MDVVNLESEIRINVIDAFGALKDSLATLTTLMMRAAHSPCWTAPAATPLDSYTPDATDIQRIVELYNQLEYLPEQDPREILVLPGIMGASPEIIEAAHAVNLAKQSFKTAILVLKNAKISIHDASLQEHFETLLGHSTPSTRRVLRKMGLARLHLKQCYRTIPILSKPPYKISWTWAHTRSIKRVSKAEADALLVKRGKDAGIEIQRLKLASLPDQEMLAIVQELAPHLRVNIVFETGEGSERVMIKGAMPFLYPNENMSTLPKIKCPSEKQQKNQDRQLRADVKLDPVAFLPAIRAHRYVG